MRRLMTIIITIATLALLLVATTYAAPTDDLTAPYDIPTEDQLASAFGMNLSNTQVYTSRRLRSTASTFISWLPRTP